MKKSVVWVSFASYLAVVFALTMLKPFFRIGYLWRPERQRIRKLELIPFDMIIWARSWFAPLFEYVGNIAFFVPLGILLVVVLPGRNAVRRAAALGFAVSLAIEISQYAFALGRTDIDDLWCNTLGAFLGAWVAVKLGPRWHRVWVILAFALGAVFAVLVALGGHLGDPSKVVDVS